MPDALSLDQWLRVLGDEYLPDYISVGGAGVKFVVPVDGLSMTDVVDGLRTIADRQGYLFVPIEAAGTRLHLVDRLFFAVADAVPWDGLLPVYVMKVLAGLDYRLPRDARDYTLSHIADLNELRVADLRPSVIRLLRDIILRDYAMSLEFRLALLTMVRAQLEPEDAALVAQARSVRDWLTGDLRFISSLRSTQIFQKVGKHNARHLLLSLAWWLHRVGLSGLVVCLDIAAFMAASRTPGMVNYPRAAVLDGYEVLRQFVDGTDEAQYCFVAVIAPPAFLDRDSRLGIQAYEALRLRISDEVHDRFRPNPLAPLVRLTGMPAPYP